MSEVVERGDLVFINLNPQAGHEQAGFRPAIVLSPSEFNKTTGFAIFCPITNTKRGWGFEVDLPDGLEITGTILTDQVKSLDWRSRKARVVCKTPEEIVERCIRNIHTFISL